MGLILEKAEAGTHPIKVCDKARHFFHSKQAPFPLKFVSHHAISFIPSK